MTERVHQHPNLIFSVGTQVVALRDVIGQNGRTLHPRGSVGVVIKAPRDLDHSYRVRFPDGVEEALRRDEVVMLARYKEGGIGDAEVTAGRSDLYDRVIYRCVIGSRAYGLDDEQSDIDYRGIFLPLAELHWSLYGVPDQIECDQTQEHYWELQRFLVLALKANPNVLECLYTPLVEKATPLAEELLEMREAFLSRLVYQTYNGYVMSQFKKMQADLRNQGQVKRKHVMHLILFVGLQGAGKSTFYRERFHATHLRINLDMLKTRHRERRLLDVCLDTQMPFVVDNTNPTRAERQPYISMAKQAGFRVVGYYFQSRIEDCLRRNQQRAIEHRIPEVGLLGTYKKLEIPAFEEGFDELHYVRIADDGRFIEEEWTDEVR